MRIFPPRRFPLQGHPPATAILKHKKLVTDISLGLDLSLEKASLESKSGVLSLR